MRNNILMQNDWETPTATDNLWNFRHKWVDKIETDLSK
jgi:hypothetical protein